MMVEISTELIVLITTLAGAFGVKEWWVGRQAKHSGFATAERQQIQAIIENYKVLESRLANCDEMLEKKRLEYIRTLDTYEEKAFKDSEYIMKLRVALIAAGLQIPERTE